jgi:hypothetical protein
MAIIQVALEVPDDIYLALLNEDLVRRGGVVRDAAGQIVAHLKEVDLPQDDVNRDLVKQAMELAKQNKVILIGIGVAAAAAAGIGVAVHAVKAKAEKKRQEALAELESSFNGAMRTYLDSVHDGNLNESALSNLICQVDEVKSGLDGGKIELDLSDGQLDALVTIMKDYTERLARANGVELAKAPKTKRKDSNPNLTVLRHYLHEQQRILEAA